MAVRPDDGDSGRLTGCGFGGGASALPPAVPVPTTGMCLILGGVMTGEQYESFRQAYENADIGQLVVAVKELAAKADEYNRLHRLANKILAARASEILMECERVQ